METTELRLLYVSHSFPVRERPLSNVGGMQRVAVDLHRAFDANPAVELHSLLLETSWRWTGLRTPPFLLRLLARIPRIVEERGIQVVLFSSMVTASVTPLLRDRIRAAGAIAAAIPVGRDVTLPNPLYQKFVPRVLRSLDLVLPISRATAAECLGRGAPADRVHVVPCGTDFENCLDGELRSAARAEVLELIRSRGASATDDSLLLLSVGRHQERKGFHWFIEEVMPKAPADTLYILAGSGPMTARIEAAVLARGLRNRVVLLGQVSESVLRTLYAGADLFVMPNIPVRGDIEGFGIVMVEAGAAGLPVIAADLEGIRDVVTEGENGVLLASRNAEAFRDAIATYRDRVELEKASARAQQDVRARFAWPSIAERHLEIFRRALSASAEEARQAAQYR